MDRSWVLNDTIFQAVLLIALLKNGRLQLLQRGLIEDRLFQMVRVWIQGLGNGYHGRGEAGPIKSGRAGDDSVKIFWIALRFHHRLSATSRAAHEISIGGVSAVI